MNNFKPYFLNIKGNLIEINKPWVMGILNVTPDSFFDGGHYTSNELALKHCEKMLNEGAHIIDIGGQSTRPNSDLITEEEELKRVIPVIELILKEFPNTLLSIDTFYAKVAQEAIDAGASIVNDISAGENDNLMLATLAKLKVPYIAMHKQGTSKTMQINPEYDDVTADVMRYLAHKKEECTLLGIKDVIIDLGFGFGKTIAHNFQLLKYLQVFESLNCPILVGISRKGMIYKTLNTDAKNALTGTIAANTIALMKGAQIIRVHDVKEVVETIKIVEQLNSQ